MSPADTKTIFLSYASQDAAAARNISESLRAHGIEVWFDQSELRGGDAWDAAIRSQIRACALFVPIISANTEDRAEGYFRREWRLAVERMHDLADDEPFLVPVVVAETPTASRVPDRFRERQWTHLPAGVDAEQQFVTRVVRLLEGKRVQSREPYQREPPRVHGTVAPPESRPMEPKPRSGIPFQPDAVPEADDAGAPINWKHRLFETRLGLSAIVTIVFGINYAETSLETLLKQRFAFGRELEYEIAAALHAVERFVSFERHDLTNAVAVYGYSAAYFFLFPLLVAGMLIGLARRRDLSPCRVYVLALAFTYAISLPFFLFFPVPERWAYPESEAILLSDLWTSSLIEAFRPFSGIDNCFPSFHVSLTVVIVLTGYAYRLRQRHTLLLLGLAVVLSTFVLGIHWLPDIVAGMAAGIVGGWLAWQVELRMFQGGTSRPPTASRLSRDPLAESRMPVLT